MKYNGYKNYETWNVNLWLNNDEGLYREVRDWIDRNEPSSYELAGWLKMMIEDMRPDFGASMFSDLLGAALSEVDWVEVAKTWGEDQS